MSVARKFKIVATRHTAQYVFAIYTRSGFVFYRTFNRTKSAQSRIRKISYDHGVDLPAKIDWDNLERGDMIELKDGSEEATVKA